MEEIDFLHIIRHSNEIVRPIVCPLVNVKVKTNNTKPAENARNKVNPMGCFSP